jgi:hypothetical protein
MPQAGRTWNNDEYQTSAGCLEECRFGWSFLSSYLKQWRPLFFQFSRVLRQLVGLSCRRLSEGFNVTSGKLFSSDGQCYLGNSCANPAPVQYVREAGGGKLEPDSPSWLPKSALPALAKNGLFTGI